MFAFLALRPIDYCSRQVNEIARERVIDSIPLNGSCIHCNNSTNYNSLPLLDCQFNTSSNPISFPCCLTTKYGDTCVYDKVITNLLNITYKIDLSAAEKIYQSSDYACIVGSCDPEKLTNYSRLLCHPYQKIYILDNQSNQLSFPLLVSIGIMVLLASLILFSVSGILFYITVRDEEFLPSKLEKDSWFRENIEDGIVYIQPKKDICCYSLLTFYLKFLTVDTVTLQTEKRRGYTHFTHRRRPPPVVAMALASR